MVSGELLGVETVNTKERAVLKRVYGCVNRMTAFGPTNPCDIEGLARTVPAVQKASISILHALSDLMYGDFENAHDAIADAEKLLGVQKDDDE